MANASLKAESDETQPRRMPRSQPSRTERSPPTRRCRLRQTRPCCAQVRNLPPVVRVNTQEEEVKKMRSPKNEIQELHAKEVGVGNPSEERASS